ncbi:NUDIX hydrolase [Saccharospirillum salsuginis]|nr:CoA pyrophosphatase [Saccharospirillum salsuginis]
MISDSSLLARMRDRLADHQPTLLSLNKPRAGVLVPMVAGAEPALLLTVRASHLNSHPGDVAFPGGMWETSDADLQQTALRETDEELNIPPDRVSVLGPLSTGLSKTGVQVYPYVGVIEQLDGCRASPDEIESWFTVPWSFFATTEPELQPIRRHGIEFHLPHYHYERWHIWGLTAMILLELINLVEETDWPLPPFSQVTRPGRGG